MFKIKSGYYVEHLTLQTRTRLKLTKDENDENVPHL